MPHVLIIDDDGAEAQVHRSTLRSAGYDVATAASGREALALVRQRRFDVLLADLRVPNPSGSELLAALRAADVDLASVIVAGCASLGCPIEIEQFGVSECLEKPLSSTELVHAVERVLGRRCDTDGDEARSARPRSNRAHTSRVLLMIENRVLRESVKTALSSQPGLEIVGSLGGTTDVTGVVRRLKVDLLLINDLSPHDRTVEIVTEVTNVHSEAKVVVIDLVDTGYEFVELIEAGASGLVLKNATVDDVVCTVGAVLSGSKVLPSALTSTLFALIGERAANSSRTRWYESDRITRREHEIIELIAEGLSNKEIATKLNIATFTVKSHVHNILEKLSLQTRVQVVRLFTQRKVNGFPPPAIRMASELGGRANDGPRGHERGKDTLSARDDRRVYGRS